MNHFFRDILELIRLSRRDNHSRAVRKACFLKYTLSSNAAILYREAMSLKEKGFDVDVICLRDFPHEEIFQNFDGLNLYRIQSRPLREKSTADYFFKIVLFFCKSTLFLTLSALHRRYDLIHVTNPPDILIFAALVPKLLGAKLILDIYDICPELYARKTHTSEDKTVVKIVKFLEKISILFADFVITVNDPWRQILISRSVSPSKCIVLLNVPDTNIFKPLPPNRTKTSNGFNLYYHGSLEEHFGVDTMLQAMPIIREHIPQTALHIYGRGRREREYKTLITKLKIDNHVTIHGMVPFRALPGILANADLGIVPTKNSVFSDLALSMKSLEYLTLGIPIVISKTTVHSYYYDSEMVAFFEPTNHKDLARCVIDTYYNPDKRKRMVDKSWEFMREHNWTTCKKRYYKAIEQLLHVKL